MAPPASILTGLQYYCVTAGTTDTISHFSNDDVPTNNNVPVQSATTPIVDGTPQWVAQVRSGHSDHRQISRSRTESVTASHDRSNIHAALGSKTHVKVLAGRATVEFRRSLQSDENQSPIARLRSYVSAPFRRKNLAGAPLSLWCSRFWETPAFIGFFVFAFTSQENRGATDFAGAAKNNALTSPDADTFFNDVLRQIIIGPSINEKQSVSVGRKQVSLAHDVRPRPLAI